MRSTGLRYVTAVLLIASLAGCTTITARSLTDRSEPRGIPFYLPKPYLVVAKNVRYIPTPTVGLTNTAPIPSSFDASMDELTMTGAINQNRTATVNRTITDTTTVTGNLNPDIELPTPKDLALVFKKDPKNEGAADTPADAAAAPQGDAEQQAEPVERDASAQNGQVSGPTACPLCPPARFPTA